MQVTQSCGGEVTKGTVSRITTIGFNSGKCQPGDPFNLLFLGLYLYDYNDKPTNFCSLFYSILIFLINANKTHLRKEKN